jgi:hypothetical protein
MKQLRTLATFDIKNRGEAHVVDVPSGTQDPRSWLHEHVCLDDEVVEVVGVETFAVPSGHAALRHRCAILVRQVKWWFVYSHTAYYPYAEIVQADSAEEAVKVTKDSGREGAAVAPVESMTYFGDLRRDLEREAKSLRRVKLQHDGPSVSPDPLL